MSGRPLVPGAADIARRIQRMARLVRNALRPEGQPAPEGVREGARPAPPRPAPQLREQPWTGAPPAQPGWWVLAQGRELDPQDFAAREAAREELLQAVMRAGVLVAENVWVWDETGRAQLVLATLPSLERARRVADRLRLKGLAVAVRRAMPEPAR